jgi:hypothetical protein
MWVQGVNGAVFLLIVASASCLASMERRYATRDRSRTALRNLVTSTDQLTEQNVLNKRPENWKTDPRSLPCRAVRQRPRQQPSWASRRSKKFRRGLLGRGDAGQGQGRRPDRGAVPAAHDDLRGARRLGRRLWTLAVDDTTRTPGSSSLSSPTCRTAATAGTVPTARPVIHSAATNNRQMPEYACA